ncbi:hypothetical protein MMC30_003044 [Trapelia coarctata]|nr:hypothetical protein [Trapelia coarctata]
MGKRGMRGKVFYCILSGSILVISLIIFLALAMSNTVAGQEFRIVLILFLLIFTVVFSHSAIRLCLASFKSKKGHRTHRRGRADTEGFAEVNRPIQVVLATDEEMALGGYDDDDNKNLPPPPPAYGLTRGSVRIDPNLLRWQRAEDFTVLPAPVEEDAEAQHRPPSYIIDHGLGYTHRTT